MIRLDAATVLLQWAVGGLLFLWVTTRRREVGIGYGWLLRATYLLLAVGAVAAGRIGDGVPVRDGAAVAVAVAAGVALVLGACSPGNNFRDLEGIRSQKPDLVEVYSNVDQHPNIAKVCIDGVAFATTTREGNSAIMRVDDWDATCPGGSDG